MTVVPGRVEVTCRGGADMRIFDVRNPKPEHPDVLVACFVRAPGAAARWEHEAPPVDGDDARLPDVEKVGVDAYVDAIFALPEQQMPAHVLLGDDDSSRLLVDADTPVGSAQRRRWDLRCPSCGTEAPVRDDRLQAVMTAARSFGWAEVALACLAPPRR